MAFLQFPILFSDDDYEKKENLGLKPTITQAIITINTNAMCAYNEMDNGHTLARMANGECYEIPLSLDYFEKILGGSEAIFDLANIADN